jgi:thiol-disulfide isomerase/thioredoxin
LALPFAVFAQSIGDTVQKVEATLGKPQLQRNTDNGQIWIYGNGTKIKFENGVVREVSNRSAASVSVVPAAKTEDAGGGSKAAAAVALHKSILGDCQDSLVKAGGASADALPLMKKRYLFIYFSAHWCPPCRAFTPKLVEFYNKNVGIGDFDLLFVSSDKNQKAMDAYMSETGMPWTGIKLGHAKIQELKQQFGVRGIPCLVLLNEKDEVLATSYDGTNYRGPDVALRKYSALHGL